MMGIMLKPARMTFRYQAFTRMLVTKAEGKFARWMASRRHRIRNRQGGAQGEDGHAELEQLLAAEAHPGSWARRLPGDVDRRGRVIGVRSSHPIPARCLRI